MCPHPPLLVPQVAAGAAAELDNLRAACDEVVRRLLATDPAEIVVVGASPRDLWYSSADYGDFGRYGGPRHVVRLGERNRTGVDALPLSIMIGAWLLGRAATSVKRRGRGVPPDLSVTRCQEIGEEIARSGHEIGLLVMGDGSARRTRKAPGHHDERAARFDADVAAALASADLDALAKLDPVLAGELLVVGRAPWQVLAGAAAGRDWRADLLYDEAPYGVGYFVASWA